MKHKTSRFLGALTWSLAAAALCLIGSATASADYDIQGEAGLYLGLASSDFLPYYLNANRQGMLTQSKDALLRLQLSDSLARDRRFDWSWGVDVMTGYTSRTDYPRWNEAQQSWSEIGRGPAYIWLQQLYGEVKWRCLFLSVGMKNRPSPLVDASLSSGDLIWSGNTRAIPEARIGFVDFQNIPFTKGWVQADICLSYGKFTDNKWMRRHANHYEGRVNTGTAWTYKRLYLRTNPEAPFHARFGFQMSGLLNGNTSYYSKGVALGNIDHTAHFKDYFDMLFPFGDGKEGYKTGDHKGSWDISLQYRFRDRSHLRAYTQFFWEDGTGMSKHNGWDGLYGLEYRRPTGGWLDGIVLEYLDFTNQSGPLQYSPADHPGTSITSKVQGRDDYYNNYYYRSYVNYGMTIGTPLVMGTIFNLGGEPQLLYNRVRAFHVALEGNIIPGLSYTVKYNHRKAWGQVNTPQLVDPASADSWMVGARWNISQVPGLRLTAEIGGDHGRLPGNAFGAVVSLDYSLDITFGRNKMSVKPGNF